MSSIAEIVLASKTKLNNRSNTPQKQHDRTIAELDEDDAKIFSSIWFRVIDVWRCYKDEDDRDWNKAKEIHWKNLDALQPTNKNLSDEILIYESYMDAMDLMLGKKYSSEWKKIKWKKYNNRQNINQPQIDLATKLKRIYMKSMSDESGEAIHSVDDMDDIFIYLTNRITKDYNLSAKDFYHAVIEPICDILPSMNSAFIKIDVETFEVSSSHAVVGSENPNLSSLIELFEQSLRVNRDATTELKIDKNPKEVYESLVAIGVWTGGYNEFKEYHPTRKQRKEKIVHEIMHTLDCAIKLRGGISKRNRNMFEQFLLNKRTDRYYI